MCKRITKNDNLFILSLKEKFPVNAYYGWEFGNVHSLYNYFVGYKVAAMDLYKQFIIYSINGEINVTDTLIFPLIFLYRHSLELCIKYLYFKYSYTSEEDKKGFLKCNHKLDSIWGKTRPYIQKCLSEQKSMLSLEIVDNYVNKFNDADSASMNFRYPITKKLDKIQKIPIKLDVKTFCDRMNTLFDYLKKIDYEISCKISYITIENFEEKQNKVINIINNHLSDVKSYIKKGQFNIDSIDLLKCIYILIYSGREIDNGIKLSKTEERNSDYIKLLIMVYNEAELIDKVELYDMISSKEKTLILKWLKISLREYNKLIKF